MSFNQNIIPQPSSGLIKATRADESVILQNEMMEEIEQVVAARQDELDQQEAKLTSLNDIRQHINEAGMSKTIAYRLDEVIRDEGQPEGSALESYSLFPNHFTIQPSSVYKEKVMIALEEMENKQKWTIAAIIAAVLGGVIATIFMFFRKTADRVKKNEEEVMDQTKKILKFEMLRNKVEKEISEAIEEVRQGMEEMQLKRIQAAYNGLIHEIYKGGDKSKALMSVFNDFSTLEHNISRSYNIFSAIYSSMDGWVSAGVFDQHGKEEIEKAMTDITPATMKENLEKIRDIAESAKSLREEKVELTQEELSDLFGNIGNPSGKILYFFTHIRRYSPFSTSSKLLRDDKFEKRFDQLVRELSKKLDYYVEKDQITKEGGELLRSFTNYVKDNLSIYSMYIKLYVMLSADIHKLTKNSYTYFEQEINFLTKAYNNLEEFKKNTPQWKAVKAYLDDARKALKEK